MPDQQKVYTTDEINQEQGPNASQSTPTPEENINPGTTEQAINPEAPNQPKKKNVKKEVLSWILTIITAVVAALLIRTFLFEPIRVDGLSMLDTLNDSELVFVTKPEYLFGSPQRQDVIICRYPGRDNTYFVKRLIGLPGDEIKIIYDSEKGQNIVYINDVALDEPYLSLERNDDAYRAASFPYNPYTLKDGEYFVMGDNRDSSNDSRSIGPITRDMIIGHVRFVFFPFNAIRGIE